MRSPAYDTAAFLVLSGVAGAFGGGNGWPVFVGREPLAPVSVITCYDTGGPTGPLIDLRTPTIQVRVRAAGYDSGWQKINAVCEALMQPYYVAAESAEILGWELTSEPAFIGRDDKDRALFTANFQMLRDGAATA